MPRLVMKFGGTSVANADRIRRVAEIVDKAAAEFDGGVAVVVSAMAGETDRLTGLCDELGDETLAHQNPEHDTVLSSGEQVTAGLLALALQARGRRARSWLGWQIPLKTNNAHRAARIEEIADDQLGSSIDEGEIAVIGGFQGVTEAGRIATLGRGGSDTSAVAVAAALGALRCDIYTDVDGVYTTDPRIEPKARKLGRISYEEMLEMAALGAKVLQTRSVELGMAYQTPIRVLSSFAEDGAANEGTLVCNEEEIVEQRVVSGIAVSANDAKVNLLTVEDHPGVAARIFSEMAEANINVDMIVQSPSKTPDAANLTFTLNQNELEHARRVLEAKKAEIGFSQIQADDRVAKISVIGVGMKSQAGVANVMFRTLADKGINIQVISTSEIKISVLIEAEYAELAVRALHAAYGLDQN